MRKPEHSRENLHRNSPERNDSLPCETALRKQRQVASIRTAAPTQQSRICLTRLVCSRAQFCRQTEEASDKARNIHGGGGGGGTRQPISRDGRLRWTSRAPPPSPLSDPVLSAAAPRSTVRYRKYILKGAHRSTPPHIPCPIQRPVTGVYGGLIRSLLIVKWCLILPWIDINWVFNPGGNSLKLICLKGRQVQWTA